MTEPSGRRVVASVQTPILRVEGVLIASIQQSLDDDAVLAFEESLLNRVAAEGAEGVVIDITAVDVVDSFMARSLNDIAAAVALLGTKLAVVGIQPAAAITLVKMGFTIPAAITALDLEQGLRLLRQTNAAAEPLAAPGATDE
jgi:rsbT antagonist protein RsbS